MKRSMRGTVRKRSMRGTVPERWLRIGFVATVLLVLLPLAMTVRGYGDSAPQTAVSLSGVGSFDPYMEQTDWNSDLYSAGLDPGYVPLSGHLGREELVSGQVDYAISGVPPTAQELAQLPPGTSLISAPVFVSALAVLAAPIAGGFGVNHYSCDPSTVDCETLIAEGEVTPTFTPYTGPINLPAAELAAAMLLTSMPIPPSQQTTGQQNTLQIYDEWDNPDILQASGVQLGQDDAFYPSYEEGDQHALLTPVSYFQSGASEQNFYAQTYASIAAPEQWTFAEQYAEGITDPNTAPAPVDITEEMPGRIPYGGISKQGLRSATQILESTPNGMSLVAPSSLYQYKNDPATYHSVGATAQWVGVQNAAGQYVDPSPASLDAAVDAGGDQPLYALTNKVAGAYPLTYVDRLYVPSTGLTQQKTEAVATLIRYYATAAQEYDATFGDGRLSPSLVNEALDAANHVVLSNCTGAGEEVVTSTEPGPYMPKLAAGSAGAADIAGIGQMLHCQASPPPPTTTTTTATPSSTTTVTVSPAHTTPPTLAGGGFIPGSGLPSSAGSAVPGSATAGTGSGTTPAGGVTAGSSSGPPNSVAPSSAPTGKTPGTTTTTLPGATGPVSLVNLPLPEPFSGGPTFDRLAALALGAVLVLVLRKPAGRLFNFLTSR